MKLKRIVSLLLVCVLLIAMAALDISASDSATLDELFKEADGWGRTPFLTLDSAQEQVGTSKIYLKNDATSLYVLADLPQSSHVTVKELYLLINLAPENCLGKDDANAKGNYVEICLKADGSNGGYSYGDGKTYAPAEDLGYKPDRIRRESSEELLTVEISVPLTQKLQSALLSRTVDVKADALVRYTSGDVELDAYSTDLHADSFDFSGRGAKNFSLTSYEIGQIVEARAWVEESRTTADFEELYGLTVNLLGDSYLKGHNMTNAEYLVWPALLAEKYDWTLTNYAENGAPLSSYVQNGITPIVTKYKEMPANDADVIIFNGGRNDYNYMTPIGTKESDDPATYMGALNVLIDGLQEKYPDALLVYTSVWNFPDKAEQSANGLTYMTYAMAAQSVCREQGILMYQAYDPSVSGVNMDSPDFRAEYCLTADDVSHLNVEGMKLVMPRYEALIADALEADGDPIEKEPESALGSEPETEPEIEPETETGAVSDTVEESLPPEGEPGEKDGFPKGGVIAIVGTAVILTVAIGAIVLVQNRKKAAATRTNNESKKE